ncbi:MAG: PPC domain-containing protein, partial [Chloroflexota bacterium]|nr:PPC domain-containing protein [Chloroflexota bacterium]
APGQVWTGTVTVEVDGSADPIGGNVAAVSSDQQGERESDPVLPPGGGDVEPGACTCDADIYEEDDYLALATHLGAGERQTHDFCDDATDWITFTAQAGDVYTITASSWGPRADTFLALFDTDGQNLLAAADDHEGATDYSARIAWQASADGVYYVRITNQARLTGCNTGYDVWLEQREASYIYLPIMSRNYGHSGAAVTGSNGILFPMGVISHTCPDAYELNDTWQQAHAIEAGVVQVHSFDSDPEQYVADKDLVSFDASAGKTITFTIAPVTNTQTLMNLYDEHGAALGVTGTTRLVWTPASTGQYYLSVGPEDGTTAFGCADAAGYNLLLEVTETNNIYLPLVARDF